ncbi:MAG: bifunctional metallophosphatase/5'-nucleotidase [Candidatus Dactylopiibacterium carminicum]|uniref:Bifunctional metallophosphatase/5'-nucleotidase n=1 Tax=Candidatus Dactylopiibacterium carminicum TaxID=857335 RepID=A0A272EVY1_9RHOO|nr:bifunctional metallophosphatase/5'-nucleotidase [Candidatus Dactylopiibacterium carminicum]KAF7599527.1 bifunctional metallophosphatase/5'-nucleotidase [Candidatus Dactylopiibacterium carminicum]PAS94278.1 MAG: bifunctional metallophosphatase/5'-nucleotidase [Candidatus Dactylopiibacterium carminicum]PAS99533.1 MAG: bifunctional metallophosphatase/5'-nucleotidase [Candidatus Dactylopiibacterium carminicum]
MTTPFLRWLAAGALISLLGACGGSDSGSDSASSSSSSSSSLAATAYTLQLLHVSDMDSGGDLVSNAKAISALVKKFRADMPDNTLFVSSGDNYIPGPFFNAADDTSLTDELGVPSAGRGDIGILNALGVQASVFGNHEFDNGTRTVADLIKPATSGSQTWPGTQFPYLATNLDFSGDSNLASLAAAANDGAEAGTLKNKIAKYAVVTVNGEKIGLVGASTPTLPVITTMGGVTVRPADNSLNALAAEIQTSVDALTASGINKVIVLAHMQQLSVERSLAPLLKDVDVIVAGGSNTGLYDTDDIVRAGDTKGGIYPLAYTSASGEPILVVNVDADYKYLGRLVLPFDASGRVITGKLDIAANGAWATDTAGLARAGVTSADAMPAVVAIADKIGAVISAKDGNLLGAASVYLEGDRVYVRNRESNLGNLSADANLAYAQQTDPSVAISLKNGGGIRSSIGTIYAPAGSTDGGTKTRTAANADVGKEAGDISQLDIEFALKCNNGLSLLTLTAEQLKQVLEHGVADWSETSTQGKFPQVGGVKFSFDPTQPNGSRVQTIVVNDPDGAGPLTGSETVYRDGALQVAAGKTYRMVTLNYLAGGGDGYPFSSFASADSVLFDRVDLVASGATMSFTMVGGEQAAFAWYLQANYPRGTPYAEIDTAHANNTRIQNLAKRSSGL